MYSVCVFFFFQAEDGIRDLVRSRGLGDVYKRQLRESARRRIDAKSIQGPIYQGEPVNGGIKIITDNKKARFDFEIIEVFEAGMVLTLSLIHI